MLAGERWRNESNEKELQIPKRNGLIYRFSAEQYIEMTCMRVQMFVFFMFATT